MGVLGLGACISLSLSVEAGGLVGPRGFSLPRPLPSSLSSLTRPSLCHMPAFALDPPFSSPHTEGPHPRMRWCRW